MPFATQHFIRRVQERIDASTDAEALAAWLIGNVMRESPDVVFVARVSRAGGRMFRFRMAAGRVFYALIDTERMNCITVMPPGFVVPCQGKDRISLKDLNV